MDRIASSEGSANVGGNQKRANGDGTLEQRGCRWYGLLPHRDKPRARIPLGRNLTRAEARKKLDDLLETGRRTGQLEALLDRLLLRFGRRKKSTAVSAGKTVRELTTAWTSHDLVRQYGKMNGLKSEMASDKIIAQTLEKRAFKTKTRGQNGPEFGDLPVAATMTPMTCCFI